ncbi:MAG: hypothetical protein PF795_06105, partial [Kiritimatiellae bacterium]|nr:hypothetical protein [Kiritimatiellia bacterium]
MKRLDMKKMTLLFVFLLSSAVAEEISLEKREELDRYLELTQAEKGFVVGLEEGIKVGFDPKNNPALAMIPNKKLVRIQEEMTALMNARFTFKDIKPEYVVYLDGALALEDLKSINALLEKPQMQKMILTNINAAPMMIRASTEFTQKLQPEIMQT